MVILICNDAVLAPCDHNFCKVCLSLCRVIISVPIAGRSVTMLLGDWKGHLSDFNIPERH